MDAEWADELREQLAGLCPDEIMFGAQKNELAFMVGGGQVLKAISLSSPEES